jgi:DMSO/TMAO reductase YedYZ molybdopterin-dependent catalytic subunit
MSDRLSRRKLITTGLAAAAGVSGLGITARLAARLADRHGLIPPDDGGIYGVGETMTYAAHRLLTARHSMAREFSRSDISKIAPVKGEPPENETYERLLAGGFADWRLRIDGLVARPSFFSLAELKRFPCQSHIYHQACEEGWSFIAEWTGVPLSYVLNLVGVLPQAKFVVFFGFDTNFDAVDKQSIKGKWNSIDMVDAWHPQTLLAYGMNGQELPTGHGAPLRLRIPRQLGGKSTKYLSLITLADTVKDIGKGFGAGGTERGFSWYAGI